MGETPHRRSEGDPFLGNRDVDVQKVARGVIGPRLHLDRHGEQHGAPADERIDVSAYQRGCCRRYRPELLRLDEANHGFDSAPLGDLSPTLLDRYLTAAQKISRLAVGRRSTTPDSDTV